MVWKNAKGDTAIWSKSPILGGIVRVWPEGPGKEKAEERGKRRERERERERGEGWTGDWRRQNGKVKLRNAMAASKVSPVPQSPHLIGRSDPFFSFRLNGSNKHVTQRVTPDTHSPTATCSYSPWLYRNRSQAATLLSSVSLLSAYGPVLPALPSSFSALPDA